MSMLHATSDYAARGWSIIPMHVSGKRPAVAWKPYEARRAGLDQLDAWFRDGACRGMAVIFGAVSGHLGSRDFDGMPSYTAWAAAHLDLALTLPTVKTRRGMHVYFMTLPETVANYRDAIGYPLGVGAIRLNDGELRVGSGCYSVVPPSPHPSGIVYEWVVPLGEIVPTIDDLVESGLAPRPAARTDFGGGGDGGNTMAEDGATLERTEWYDTDTVAKFSVHDLAALAAECG
ncbi:MAG: bifunctional DNA primase/polymerase [Planctomycetaceae bacterium]|nr:bifunctional DNA primase/polymerase [Planctomycetaceae bacterium]